MSNVHIESTRVPGGMRMTLWRGPRLRREDLAYAEAPTSEAAMTLLVQFIKKGARNA